LFISQKRTKVRESKDPGLPTLLPETERRKWAAMCATSTIAEGQMRRVWYRRRLINTVNEVSSNLNLCGFATLWWRFPSEEVEISGFVISSISSAVPGRFSGMGD
jgi:hypothetical protein